MTNSDCGYGRTLQVQMAGGRASRTGIWKEFSQIVAHLPSFFFATVAQTVAPKISLFRFQNHQLFSSHHHIDQLFFRRWFKPFKSHFAISVKKFWQQSPSKSIAGALGMGKQWHRVWGNEVAMHILGHWRSWPMVFCPTGRHGPRQSTLALDPEGGGRLKPIWLHLAQQPSIAVRNLCRVEFSADVLWGGTEHILARERHMFNLRFLGGSGQKGCCWCKFNCQSRCINPNPINIDIINIIALDIIDMLID